MKSDLQDQLAKLDVPRAMKRKKKRHNRDDWRKQLVDDQLRHQQQQQQQQHHHHIQIGTFTIEQQDHTQHLQMSMSQVCLVIFYLSPHTQLTLLSFHRIT